MADCGEECGDAFLVRTNEIFQGFNRFTVYPERVRGEFGASKSSIADWARGAVEEMTEGREVSRHDSESPSTIHSRPSLKVS